MATQADQVDADARDTLVRQCAQIVVEYHHRAETFGVLSQTGQQKPVVGAEKAGLHEHRAGNVVLVEQCEVGLDGGVVVRHVSRVFGRRQAAAEDVGMTVDYLHRPPIL